MLTYVELLEVLRLYADGNGFDLKYNEVVPDCDTDAVEVFCISWSKGMVSVTVDSQ